MSKLGSILARIIVSYQCVVMFPCVDKLEYIFVRHIVSYQCFVMFFSVGKLGNVLVRAYFVSATMFLEVGKQGNWNRKHNVFETVCTEVNKREKIDSKTRFCINVS